MYFVLSVGFGECRASGDEKGYFKDGREGDYLLLRQVLLINYYITSKNYKEYEQEQVVKTVNLICI